MVQLENHDSTSSPAKLVKSRTLRVTNTSPWMAATATGVQRFRVVVVEDRSAGRFVDGEPAEWSAQTDGRRKLETWIERSRNAGWLDTPPLQCALEVVRAEGPPSSDVAFTRSMELLDLAPSEDPFRERDVAQARAAWVKLRAWAGSRADR